MKTDSKSTKKEKPDSQTPGQADSLLENSKELICIMDPSGKVIKVNDLALEYFPAPTPDKPVQIQQFLDPVEATHFEKVVSELSQDGEHHGVIRVANIPGARNKLLKYTLFYITTEPEPLLAAKGHFTTIEELHNSFQQGKEEIFKGIYEHSSEAIVIFDQYLTCIDGNKTLTKLSKYSKKELVGKTLQENGLKLFDNEHFADIVQHVWSGNPESFETNLIAHDGTVIPVELALRVGKYFGQRVLIASVRDISERKHEEVEILQRNRQLEFFNSLLTDISTCTSALEVYTKAFQGITALNEISAGALYCLSELEEKAYLTNFKGFEQLTLPEIIDLEELVNFARPEAIGLRLTNLLKRKSPRALTADSLVVPFVSDEKLKAFLLLSPHQSTKANQLPAMLRFVASGISSYISRTYINQRLSQSENKYKALFEMAQDGILLLDNGLIVEANPAGAAFFGVSKNRLVGKRLTDFTAGGQLQSQLHEAMAESLETGKVQNLVWMFSKMNGSIAETELSINRVLLHDRHFLQVIIRDKTNERNSQRAAQQALVLNETNSHLRGILGRLDLTSVGLTISGRITSVNDLFCQITGYSANELIDQDFFRLFFRGEDQQNLRNQFELCIRSKKIDESFEKEIMTKEGEVRTLDLYYVLDYDELGDVSGVSCIGHDITEGKNAIEELHDNRLQMQDLIDNAYDLIHRVDIQNRFLFTNRAWQVKLGYSVQELEQMVLTDVIHPDYRDIFVKQIQNLYQGRQRLDIETVFLTKQGEPVYLNGSISCQYSNYEPVATRAILHDVTERIKADRIQRVYYSIANLAISTNDLQSLYKGIHTELSKIIDTTNIYIALHEADTETIHFPYLIDTQRPKPLTNHKRSFQSGLTEYIIKTGKPLLVTRTDINNLTSKGLIQPYGILPEVYMGSPLKIGERIIGVVAVQSSAGPKAYSKRDLDILHFISNQIALAIERKSNEEQINKQNARLKAIFECTSHLMWSVDKQGNITSFNQNYSDAIFAHFGRRPVLNMRNDKTGVPFPTDGSESFWFEKYALAFEGLPQQFVTCIPDLQGNEIWREVFLNPIYLEDGTLEEVSGIAHDITENKKAEQALKDSEEKFRRIFESILDVYYRTDMDGYIQHMSPSVTEVLGYTQEEVIGMHGSEFYEHPEDRELLIKTVIRHGRVRNFEVSMRCKSGVVIQCMLNSQIILDENGNAIGIEGVAKDISELKETQAALIDAKEQAENLLKVKSQFLANMSHELRTPMNGIIGMIELLAQTKMSPEQRDYTETLRKSSEALLVILNDILDLSKIQAGKLEINQTTINLKVAIDKIYSLFLNRAYQKGLNLTFTISPNAPRFIKTDETRLLQILSNLVSNAIKFTNTGEVSVHVMEAERKGDQHVLLFEVRDTGIGIKEESQHLLFSNFTQLDTSSSKTFSGTGLGLAISMQLTKLLGGDIGVRSTYGHGSTFWFTITCTSSAETGEVETIPIPVYEEKSQAAQLSTSPYVLLVDDNQINQKVAARMLEKIGCRVDLADNGYQAIEKATQNGYNYVFMDIQMPEMDGIEATRQIKSRLGAKCPPIIAMTAYSMKNDAEKFMNAGLDDYISKPVSQNDLLKLLQRYENKQEQTPVVKKALPANVAQVINLDVFDQLKQVGGMEFAMQLYTEFEEESDKLLAEMRKNIFTKNYREILSNLHQLKGTAGTLGVLQVAAQAKKLEEDIKNGKLNTAGPDIDQLDALYLEFRNSYRDLFNRI